MTTLRCFFFLFVLLNISFSSFAQITTSPIGNTNQNAIDMVDNLVGQGVTVSNQQFIGTGATGGSAASNHGTFNSGSSTIGLSTGIVLCTGNILDIPNNDIGSNSYDYTNGGDADLTALVGTATYDAMGLQFDFVPEGNYINFDYVFGSDEYNEYVSAGFNDVFAFYVTSLDADGYNYNKLNIALLPSTSTAVSIDNVNLSTNSSYFFNNESAARAVEPDGFTTVLTASCPVTACKSYRLKLVVADAGDYIYDSYVFLEKGSLSSPSLSSINATYAPVSAGTAGVEGCNTISMRFSLAAPAGAGGRKIPFTLGGSANLPLDYTTNPNIIPTFGNPYPGKYYVNVPQGQTYVDLVFTPLADGIPESDETIDAVVDVGFCIPETQSGTLIIKDKNVSLAGNITNPSPEYSCNPGGVTLNTSVTGGWTNGGPYNYSWSPATGLSSTTVANPFANPTSNTTYTVTVTDACNATVVDSRAVTVTPLPTANISYANSLLCTSVSTDESVTLTGTNNYTGGVFSATPAGLVINASFGAITPGSSAAGTYTISYTIAAAGGCPAVIATTTMTISASPNIISATKSDVFLCGGSDGTISIVATGSGTLTYSIDGITYVANSGAFSGLPAGNYPVSVKNSDGCLAIGPTLVIGGGSPTPPPTIPSPDATYCLGETIASISAQTSGGGNITWYSNAGLTTVVSSNAVYDPNPLPAGIHTFYATETVGGCRSNSSDVTITVNPIPDLTTSTLSPSVCNGNATSIDLSSLVSGTTVDWTVSQSMAMGATNGLNISLPFTISQILSFGGTSTETAVYIITPTANSCVGTPINVIVTVNPNPDVIATVSTPIICSGDTTDISFASSISGTSFNWTAVQNNATGALAGTGTSINQQLFSSGTSQGFVTYTVIPSTSNCSGTSQNIDITINPVPDLIVNPPTSIICSGTAPYIDLSSTIPGTSFSWTVAESLVTGASNGGGSPISQILNCTDSVTGTTTYTIVPSVNTCSGLPYDLIVTVNPVPGLIANPLSETICTYGTTAINLSSNVAGASFSWTVSYSTNIFGPSNGNGPFINQTLYDSASVADIATYTVISSNLNCSSLPLDIIITINPFPRIIATPDSESVCSGTASNILLNSNVSGTAFSWTVSNSSHITGASNANGLIINQTLTNDTSITDSVLYTVIASANSCSGDTLDIPIYVFPQPVIISADTTYTNCGGADGTITISASGINPLEYSINNSVTFFANGGFFTGLGNGNYQVAVRDSNGCITNGPLLNIVELNAPPAPLAGTDSVYCNNVVMADMTATASVGGILTWYADAALTNVITTGATLTPFDTIGTTTYYVTEVTGGCESPSSDVTITINPPPVLISTPPSQTFCSGSSTSLTFTSIPSGATFDWTVVQNNVLGAVNGSGSFINQTLTTLNSSAGSALYYVTPLLNGCYGDSTEITVIVNPLPDIVLNVVSEVCQNVPSIILNGGSPPGGNYSGPGIVDTTFFPGSAGLGQHLITYTYIDGNGCVNSATDSININQLPIVTLAAFSPVCADATPFVLNGGSPAGGTYYGNGITAGVFDPVAAGIGNGQTITYSYTLDGCTNTATNTIDVRTLPIVNVSLNTPITCNGSHNGTAIANVISGTGTLPYSYLWDNIPPSTSSTVTGLYPNIWYHVSVTDFIGCKDIDSISITEPNILTILPVSVNPTCGLINGSASVTVNGGTFPYTYLWSNGGTASSIINIASGVYFVTATDAHGCIVDTMISLTTFPSVNAIFVVTNPTCYGYSDGTVQTVITGGTSPFSYLWSNGAITSTITGLTVDTLSVIITDVHSCSFADTVIISQPLILELSLLTTDVACFDQSDGIINTFVSGGSAPYSYLWSTGLTNSSLTAASGSYSITVTDSNLCTASATDTIFQPLSVLSAVLIADSANCWGDSSGFATVTPIGGTPAYTFLWSTDPIQTTDHAINLKAGIYFVTVTDIKSCNYIDTVRIYQPSKIEINSVVIPTSCDEGDDGQIEVHPFGGFSPYSVLFYSEPQQADSIAENLIKGLYEVKITDKTGCYSKYSIEVKNTDIPCLQIPSAFTPNVDGIHDIWNIKNLYLYPKAKIEVYNRWGSLIYSAGVTDKRWDGKYNGVDVSTGTYIYIINLNNETKPKQGTVTVIR